MPRQAERHERPAGGTNALLALPGESMTTRPSRAKASDEIGKFGAVATTLIVVFCAAVGYGVIATQPRLLADEGFHAPQVWTFLVGDFQTYQSTTMLPGYHAILALLERIIGYHDDALLRFLNLLGSLLLPVFVWRLVAMYAPQEAGRRTVQWFLMPLLFPLFFLVYTDAWALAAVLATLFSALRRRFLVAGFAGLAACLLRQDMITWVGMAWLLALLGDLDIHSWRKSWRRELKPAIIRGFPLLVVLLSFAGFFLWPQNVQALPRLWRLLRNPLCLALLAAGFAIYMGTYANEHMYNSPEFRFYLRNEGLYWMTKYTWIRAVAFVPMAWMVLTLCVTRLAEPRLYIFYFVAFVSVGLHPLIEQRYYLPALTLFQVWRPTTDARWENELLVMYATISPLIMWGITREYFFL